jgi:hypothetical protein
MGLLLFMDKPLRYKKEYQLAKDIAISIDEVLGRLCNDKKAVKISLT